jgi:LPXTG-motif cell wall-anchored protein
MNKSVIYIVGATVLLGGGAFLFLKNKKKKDLLKLAEAEKIAEIDKQLGGANLNLANATILATERKTIIAQPISRTSLNIQRRKLKLEEIDRKLATLGYKVDAIGQLVKI